VTPANADAFNGNAVEYLGGSPVSSDGSGEFLTWWGTPNHPKYG